MVIAAVDEKIRASRRRFWLAVSGFAVVLGLALFSNKVEYRLETAVHISGGEAEAVDHELLERFQSPCAHRLVVVIQGLPDNDPASSAEVLASLTDTLRSVPGVSDAVSSLYWPDPLVTGRNAWLRRTNTNFARAR
jgi:RND superfamily putative drug exporter